jgi:membrane fusion protein, multidrug efflux system
LLRPGQYVKARLIIDLIADAVLAPQQAVTQMQNLYGVFALKASNVLRPRIVEAGKRIGTGWVINNGLKPGEQVVIVGNAVVRLGSEVAPVPMNCNYDSSIMIR